MTTRTENDPFISRLVAICDDKGRRAELRRYWSPATIHYSYPALGRLGALARQGSVGPDAITAALFAINPNHVIGGYPLGKALLKLAGGSEKADGFDSFERHFRRLLSCDGADLQDLADQLHRLFKRLERETLALDYNELLWNLRKWNSQSESIKTRWASQFWTSPAETEFSPVNDRT